MIQDMKTILTRMFTVVVLMMISMAARADVKVLYGEKGTDKFEGKGGSIKIEQADFKDDKTKVTVYLTFIPQSGYTFDGSTLEVYAVVSPGVASTRALEISGDPLKLTEEKTDVSSAKSYSVNIDPALALWVKRATFHQDGSKRNRGDIFLGKYYIANFDKTADGSTTGNYDSMDKTKNYYLVPANSCFYDPDDPKFVTTDNGKPHLTTYKTFNHLDDIGRAVWEVYEVEKNGNTYYRFLHLRSNKYLTANKPKKVSNTDGRLAVHLEEMETPDDATTLFIITGQMDDKVYIRPNTTDWGWGSGKSLNPNSGNKDQYAPNNDKGGIGGTIGTGVATGSDYNSYWYFEEVPPEISFAADDNVQITYPFYPSDATIYYTTNGDNPTTNDSQYSGPFTVSDDVTIIKAIAVRSSNSHQTPVSTFVTPVLPGSSRPYLFKNLGSGSTEHDGFFMLRGDVISNEITVNTSSLARPSMRWYFKSAGLDNGYQYFYIYNTGLEGNDENYLFCNSSGTVYLKSSLDFANSKSSDAFDSASDDYKFRILDDESGRYRIVPKAKQTVWLHKLGTNSNNAADVVGTGTNNNTNLQSRWNFIPVFDNKMPAALRPSPFNVTTSSGATYYKIGNASATNAFIIPGTTYATTSATDAAESNDMKWYFMEAGEDDWLTYYYIVNATTGKYLYLRDGLTTAANDNAFITQYLSEGNAEQYQFVVAKTTESASAGKYYIVPKLLKDLTFSNYSLIWRDNTKALKTQAQRADGARKWTFTSTTINVVAPPVISFDNSTKELTFEAIPSATIYYSTDGTEPTNVYNPTSKPTLDFGPVYTVKAKAQLGEVVSEMASEEMDLSLVKPTIEIEENEVTGKATVTLNTIQTGVPIYYTQDGTQPTTTNGTLYDGSPFEVNLPAEGETIRITAVAINIVSETTYTSDPIVGIIGGENFSGFYYIQSNKSTANYLNVSGTKNGDGKPYATTGTTQNISAVWKLVREGEYYYIIHYDDNTYLTASPTATTNSAFLSGTESDDALFEITRNGDQLLIKAKNADNADGKNYLYYNGTNPIQLGASSADQTKWNLLDIPSRPWVSQSDIVFTMGIELGTVYYTVSVNPNETTPTKTDEYKYSGPFRIEYGPEYQIRAIGVYTDKEGIDHISNYSNTYQVKVADPQVFYHFNPETGKYLVSISNGQSGISFRYTLDSSNPTATSGTVYDNEIPLDAGNYTIKVIAYNTVGGVNYSSDNVTTVSLSLATAKTVYSYDDIDDPEGTYILDSDFTQTGTRLSVPFTGILDGQYNSIELSAPLFDEVNGGTIKNVVVSNVSIKSGTNIGAICNEASGSAKIYNCGVLSGSVKGSGNVGGLVGLIKSGSSVRVVNCYNFATVSGGTTMAGIVGNNEGTVGEVRIAMCMMYGNMAGTSPVYAGNHESNVQKFTEYNYWRYRSGLTYTPGNYNDQLAIDKDDYLTRFPFYRHILNSHRELAAYFLFAENTITGNVGDISSAQVNEIGHWVLDKSKANYPIVEEWEKNTRKVLDAPAGSTVSIRKGDGTAITSLNVTVKIGNNTYNNVSLPITGMDEANHDYTWGKVVLPFANEFEENTDYSQICTGWKVTDITGGTEGSSFSKYDVSDRDCTSKDLYSTTGFIFAQGGNYIVPYNVTDIEITANFATAYYLRDEAYDIGYSGDKPGNSVSGYVGRTPLGGTTLSTYHGQTVYNTLADALGVMSASGSTHSQAVVLVGNYHQDDEDLSSLTSKGLTIMSIDADNNQEPDYAWYSNNTQDRPLIPPTRFDFVALIPVGMSSRVNNSTFYPGIPIWKPCGWFELTETSLLKMDQFELNSNNFNTSESDTRNYRCIINGGYFTQMVRSRKAACTQVKYYQIGGKAYVKEFYPGSHSADSHATILCPINVTGGEIEQCFMTGYGKGTAIGKNIYFWCAGGKIDKFLGAYMEKPRETSKSDGIVNMTAKIDHAKIGKFFGGGTSPKARITGNIDVIINNSTVDFYYGGPEFGDIGVANSEGVITNYGTVTTHAIGTTFGEYYGAGFGGTAVTYTNDEDNNTQGLGNASTKTVTYPSSFFTNHYAGGTNAQRLEYLTDYGIGSSYKFEFIFNSRGAGSVARFYTGYAKFSLATTGNVTNELEGCTILNDFYGAGCQGKVSGTVTSTLTGCTVKGSAFGGGYKAENNIVDVYTSTAPTMSVYTRETGIFSDFGTLAPEQYTWVQGTNENNNKAEGNTLYTGTDVTLTDLGNVTGNISLTINGGYVGGTSGGMTPATEATATTEAIPAGGNVYGGGNESRSLSDTSVTLKGNAVIYGDVFGGGNKAEVQGNATVNIQ